MGVETTLRASRLAATSAMTDDNRCTFNLPSVSRKKVTAAFDGGRLSSDSGVMLLALADRRRKVSDTLAEARLDSRDQARRLPHHGPARRRPRAAAYQERQQPLEPLPADRRRPDRATGALMPDRRRG